jgi:hypothetical protein
VQGSSTLILMLHTSRQTWERRQRRSQMRAWRVGWFSHRGTTPFPIEPADG